MSDRSLVSHLITHVVDGNTKAKEIRESSALLRWRCQEEGGAPKRRSGLELLSPSLCICDLVLVENDHHREACAS
jgi:hypothetical protein